MTKLKELYKKLVDKIFGKRCECTNIVKDKVDRQKFVCQDCGKILSN